MRRLNLTIRSKLMLGFGTGLIILCVISMVSFRGIGRLLKNSKLTEHTYEIIEHINLVLLVLKDAETGERGFIITGEERYLEPYNKALERIDQELENLQRQTIDNPGHQRRLKAIKPILQDKISYFKETIQIRQAKGLEAVVPLILSDRGMKAMDDIQKIFLEMVREEEMVLAQQLQKQTETVNAITSAILYGALMAAIFFILASIVITRTITKPIHLVVERVNEIAEAAGDLTNELSMVGSDEIGQLAKAFNKLLTGLRTIIWQIRDSSERMNSACGEILAASQVQATGAGEQSTAVAETTTAAKQLATTSEQVGESIRRVSQVANHALVGMARIKDTISKTGDLINSLGEKSQKIGKITDLIDDVADQTNLLAVNASIEAARAGEEGRGFTVVADEIRKLSDSTAKSTKEITSLIEVIQHEMSNAVISMEQSINSVDEEAKLAQQTTERAKEIAMSANQQISGSRQIAEAMTSLNTAMKEVVTSSEQTKGAVEELTELSSELKRLTAKFKLE
ncbi:MAG: CHASE3 domain-containing protein [Candidatus Omnitrophota bacterium]